MPLLLAIEPDSRQAEWIGQQARGPLGAELIVTDSVAAALRAMEKRVPDLILTSLLLSPRDEATLQDRLRWLDGQGIRVQTLVIPVLAEPSADASGGGGMFSRLRKLRPGASHGASAGCDPAVFGQQIAEYLEREGTRTRPAVPRVPEPAAQPLQEAVGCQETAEQEVVTRAPSVVPAVAGDPVEADALEDAVFSAGDRAWRPAAAAASDEFDAEALLAVVEQIALRRRSQGQHASLS
ncbi:MAG: hypothetical protein AB7F99_03515 [Vicinamibacterales bacterium]